MSNTMKAIVIEKFGGPEVLVQKQVPQPEPEAGFVKIWVKAFGLNHAEMHMRKGEWDESNPISGIECVGVVAACPGGEFEVGTKVAAVMGGMGRTIPGSYAEFTSIRAENVMRIDSELSWDQLAALPETYAVAWECVFGILAVRKGQSVLIRGATSNLGKAAVNLAVDAGAIVTGTTRSITRSGEIEAMGATFAREQQGLDKHVGKFDAVLNLVGNSVLVESIGLARRHGHILQAGWLGGLAPVKDFNPMIEMESGVHFSLFHSKVLGTPEWPLSEIPFSDIANKISRGAWDAKPAHIIKFDQIQEAHRAMDRNEAVGKTVVLVD